MAPPKQPIFPATHFARFGRWLEMESHAERQRLEDMMKYPTTPLCRQRFIVDYFGEAVGDWICRVCDRCTSHDHAERREPTAAENGIIVAILTAVQELNGRFGRSRIAQVLAGSKNAEVMRFGLNHRNSYGALSQCDQPLLIKMIDSLRDGAHRTQQRILVIARPARDHRD